MNILMLPLMLLGSAGTAVGAIGADAYPGGGHAAGAVWLAHTAFKRDGGTAAIARMGGLNFIGAWFTSAWLDQGLAFDGCATASWCTAPAYPS